LEDPDGSGIQEKTRIKEISVNDWRVLALCLAVIGHASPGKGAVLETFRSEGLNRAVPIALHVPADAVVTRWTSEHPGAPMQLVLFLPGAFDGPKDFIGAGLEAFLSDQEAQGKLPPSLWVVVTHFKSWYADRADGRFPYERFLMDELIPFLEARHPGFGGQPSARSITGLSMGGFGALNLAARTGAFSKCLALSPALVEPPFKQVGWLLRRSLNRTFPQDLALFAPWNPWKHLGGAAELVVGCGTEDKYGLAEACRTFAQVCQERNRPMVLELRSGGHDWAYWTPTFKRWTPWLLGVAEEDSSRREQGPVFRTPFGPMIGP
jgi:S-formylglutathione hydrolase FrmB